jgi:hypothetical protein
VIDPTLDRINIGDFVRVDFHNANYTLTTRSEVLGMPQGPGDGWLLKDVTTGLLRSVSEGCTITKLTA